METVLICFYLPFKKRMPTSIAWILKKQEITSTIYLTLNILRKILLLDQGARITLRLFKTQYSYSKNVTFIICLVIIWQHCNRKGLFADTYILPIRKKRTRKICPNSADSASELKYALWKHAHIRKRWHKR